MKNIIYIIAFIGLVSAALLTGCKKDESSSTPATPAMPSTNAPATNAPAQ